MTRFRYYNLHEAHLACGVVVVIDVLRAFTTAAHAFDAGAARILPVASVSEALALRDKIPGALVMGEVDGEKPVRFDFGNSPVEIRKQNLAGCTLIQPTSAGTQGLVRAQKAEGLFAASFVVARATALQIQALNASEVSFVVTGSSLGRDGDEDRACGAYIQAILEGCALIAEPFTQRVRRSSAGASFLSEANRQSLREDLDLCIQTDRFDFSMPINCQGEFLEMRHDRL